MMEGGAPRDLPLSFPFLGGACDPALHLTARRGWGGLSSGSLGAQAQGRLQAPHISLFLGPMGGGVQGAACLSEARPRAGGTEESLRLPAHWAPAVGKWQDQCTLTLCDGSRGEGGAKEGEARYTKGTPWGQGP